MKKYGILLAFLAITSWANATIYYLKSTAGSPDAWNDKDAANVVKDEIDKALAKLTVAGDELWIAKGTYKLTSQRYLSSTCKIYAGFNGTETEANERDYLNNPVVVTVGENVAASAAGSVICLNANDIVLDGIRFNGENVVRASDTAYWLINAYTGKTGIVVQNCSFDNFVFSYTSITTSTSIPAKFGCILLNVNIILIFIL